MPNKIKYLYLDITNNEYLTFFHSGCFDTSGDLLLRCTGFLNVSVSSLCGEDDSALVEQVFHQLNPWNEFVQVGLLEREGNWSLSVSEIKINGLSGLKN